VDLVPQRHVKLWCWYPEDNGKRFDKDWKKAKQELRSAFMQDWYSSMIFPVTACEIRNPLRSFFAIESL
jgi:hypothetical protein